MNVFKKLVLLENAAADYGFEWEHSGQIMDQIQSECMEVKAHLESYTPTDYLALQEEMGDLLHAVFSLCVFCKINPQDTLEKSVTKFERRFNAVKQLAHEQGFTSLKGCSFEKLMNFWNQAKQTVG